MPDRCARPIELLVAFDDGDLPDSEQAALQDHIATCLTCQTRLAGLRQTTATLRTAPVPVDEVQLLRSIQARIVPVTRERTAQHGGTIHPNGQTGDIPLVAATRLETIGARPRRSRRLIEIGQFVAAGLAIVLVASLLVVLFRDVGNDSSSGELAGTGSPVASIPAAATTDVPVRLIAWANDVYGDGAFKVVVSDSAGATPGKLMSGPFFEDMSRERSPVWSPNGSMVAFVTDRDGNDELYVVSGRRPGSMTDPNATGIEVTGPRNITNDPGSDSDPNWSPDSRWIAFSSRRDDNLDIYLTQAGSAEAARMTTSPGADSEPVWSPDGFQIAYRSERRDGSGAYDIKVMNANGSEQRRVSARLSAADGISSSPVWSPDGRRLAFTTILYSMTDGTAERIQINVVDVETGETQIIADDPFPHAENAAQAMVGADSVDWSPDGTLLVFTRPIGEQYDIALANPDGSGLTMLTNTRDRDEVAPLWSPESLQLLYVSLAHGPTNDTAPAADLRIIDRSGSNDTQVAPLTVQAALASRPAWGPLASEAGEPIPDAATPAITADPTATRVPEPPISTLGLPEPDPDVCAHSQPAFPLGVFVMNADGSQQQLLPLPEQHLEHVVWSPNGSSLLGTTGGDIVVLSSDGSNMHVIVNDDDSYFKSAIWSPDGWSPNGSKIAYIRGDHSSVGTELYSANPDGSDIRLLRSIDGEVDTLTWSPDGTRIAYAAKRDDIWNIFSISADGSDEQQITSSESGAENPSWSADGRRIRYMTEIDQMVDFYALDYFEIDLATGETRHLDIFETEDYAPVWSPDDSRIVFQSLGDIWSMAADGSDRRNLTQHPIGEGEPVWSPNGQQIIFLSHRVYWQPASEVEGQPEQIVLRAGESSQAGGGGRWCQNGDVGEPAHDVVGVVLPAEPLELAAGTTIQIDISALGTPTAIAVDIYDLTVAEQLGQLQDSVLTPPCRTDEGCLVETIAIPASLTPSLILDLPPGRYALAVRVNFDGAAGSGYTDQGFSVVVQ